MIRLIASEHEEAVALVEWVRLYEPKYPDLCMFFAVPNQGAGRNKRLQMEGAKPGVCDYFLLAPRGRFHGLGFELKRRGGHASIEQLQWLGELRERGYCAEICIGWERARDQIVKYLTL